MVTNTFCTTLFPRHCFPRRYRHCDSDCVTSHNGLRRFIVQEDLIHDKQSPPQSFQRSRLYYIDVGHRMPKRRRRSLLYANNILLLSLYAAEDSNCAYTY